MGFILLSCSDNNDSLTDLDSNPFSDALLGTWQRTKAVHVCSTGSEEVFNLGTCTLMDRLVFLENGTYDFTVYDSTLFGCELSSESSGKWFFDEDIFVNIVNGETYRFTFFELTNDILRIGDNVSDQGISCDGDSLRSHQYTEFIRVE